MKEKNDMTDKQLLAQELRKKPINKEKYVRDKIRYGSKQTAVRKQKPFYGPSAANKLVRKLEQDDVVKNLSDGIMEKMVELNAKRLLVVQNTMDSDDPDLALKGAQEAGRVIDKFQDRVLGRPKQSVEVKNTKVTISLNMSDGAVSAPRDDFIEAEEVTDGNNS